VKNYQWFLIWLISFFVTNAGATTILTQERDWETIVVNEASYKGLASFTKNDSNAMLGASCELDGQRYSHVHFVLPVVEPKVFVSSDSVEFVNVNLKAGHTEFDTALLVGKTYSGKTRLYYPTYQSNGSIIQRLIDAKSLAVTYRDHNNKKITEFFSLMGYTHNVTTNVNACEKLNKELALNELTDSSAIKATEGTSTAELGGSTDTQTLDNKKDEVAIKDKPCPTTLCYF